MSTVIGNQAEDAAAAFLQEKGYKIVERNWRTRVCEIDVIAKKNHIMFFIEVKYRGSQRQGGGLDYIKPKKLQVSQDFIVTDHIVDL